MGSSSSKTHLDRAERDLSFNRTTIRRLQLSLFCMNNLDKIYRQSLEISLGRLGLHYSKEQHGSVLVPFMAAF